MSRNLIVTSFVSITIVMVVMGLYIYRQGAGQAGGPGSGPRARRHGVSSGIAQVLAQDVQDLTALEVTKTPTLFVNGRSLPSFGHEQPRALVREELERTKK